ncbi:molybdopterin molybdotransferase MoeA [Alphaproteobacteria bacterium]|nr:molybdopterin molybdotransferase MoeA [Alphaproteobacteria bacterium]
MRENAFSISEVTNLLIESVNPLGNRENVPVHLSVGRICDEDVDSRLRLPSSHNAAVDGFAFHYQWAIANPDHRYDIVAQIKAGHPYSGEILPGQAVAIFTGAMVPEGLDCIAMQETCHLDKDKKVRISVIPQPGSNIRKAGENLALGEQIIKKGHRITAADIGQLSAVGRAKISCFTHLSVAVLSTGDEVVDASYAYLQEGQIYDTNRPMLQALINQGGHICTDFGIIKDNKVSLQEAYQKALEKCDVVISSGGASQGIEDHTQDALSALGFEVIFWRIAMKPGRPMAVGKRGKQLVICLPGNPVAAFVCYRLIVSALLTHLQGGIMQAPLRIALPAQFRHSKSANRAEYLRAKLVRFDDNRTGIALHGRKGAGVISSLTGADGLVEIPIENSGVEPGMMLDFLPFMEKSL